MINIINASSSLGANFQDKRLSKRFNKILKTLKNIPNGTIPQACQNKGQVKGFYRFLHNKKVNVDAMIEAHISKLLIHQQGYSNHSQNHPRRYLFISDSVELDYTSKKSSLNLGPLTYRKRRGMILHNTMMLSDLGVPTGIFSQSYIIRNDEDFGKWKERKHLPIEEKESAKWLNDFKKVQDYAEEKHIEAVFIGDREADIMDIFHARSYENMHYVIRSNFDRCLANSTSKLYSVLKQQKVQHTYEIQVSDPQTLQVRTATLAVRYCPVALKLYTRIKRKKYLGVNSMNALEVYELNPPNGVKPIRWILLTSLPIRDFSDALQIIQYYIWRWTIERFHFLLKSGGAEVEKLQIQKAKPLKNAITLYSITIMDIMKIKKLAESQPDMCVYDAGITSKNCEILYTYAQHEISKRIFFDKDKPPTVWEFCRVLGMIGGFIPSKRQPIPGLKILARAMEKFNVITLTYNTFMSKN